MTEGIVIALNGEKLHLTGDVLKSVWSYSLNDFLRTKTCFKSAKIGCGEGGCGACTVAISRTNDEGEEVRISVNSCLCPLLSLDGCAITTVEGLSISTSGSVSSVIPAKCTPFGSTALHPALVRFVTCTRAYSSKRLEHHSSIMM